MNTGYEDYEQTEVFALLTRISVSGLRTRMTGRPTDVFVTVAVDGEQQFSSEVICDNLQPVWEFSDPRRLSVYPSSTVKFTVYRRRRTLEMIPDKYIGEFEAPLHTFINEGNVNHDLAVSHMSREKGSISVEFYIDTSQVPHHPPNILQHASDKLDHVLDARAQEPSEKYPVLKSAGSIVSHAMSSLDHLVAIADDVAEVHPIAKVAWTLFSAIYKSIKHRREMDKVSRGLLLELKDVLAEVRECQNLKALRDATDAVKSLAELVAEGATLLDEYMKRASPVRTVLAAWGSIESRIRDCQSRLEKHRQQLLRVLVIRIHQNVVERTSESVGPSCTGPHPNRTPSPLPSMPNLHGSAGWMPEGQQYPPVAGVDSAHPPLVHQFPMPTLYPFVKEITTSPDALSRSKELPDTCFFAPSTKAPTVPTRQPSPSPRSRPAQRNQSPSRREATDSTNEIDPEHLEQLKQVFPTFEGSILETVLASVHGSVENAIEVLLDMSRSPSSLPEDEYPVPRRPPSPLRLGCTQVLGLKVLTESPRSIPPPLSRTQSSSDESDVSALTTPDTSLFEETYLRGASHGETVSVTRTSSVKSTSSIGSDRYYDGFTGGFCPPRVANRMYGPPIVEPIPHGWVPGRPLGGF